MSTLIKIKKDQEVKETKSDNEMTPESIVGKLFFFHDVAHKFHLDTGSYEIHKSLDGLYKGLVDFKDEISEMLIGYMDGKRIGKISIDSIPEYSDKAVMKLAEDLKDFSHELCEWASGKEYLDIENTAQSLSGLAAKTIYFLTLK